MGNVCLSREEQPDEDFKIYQKHKKLQEEVCSTLGNRERFADECGLSYRAACESRKVQHLNKPLMMEMTRCFLQKLACDDDPRMVAKIYSSLERQFPKDDEVIPEASFKDFIQDVLMSIDRDISEKLRKLEMRYPGVPATQVRYNEYDEGMEEGFQQRYSRLGVRDSQMQEQKLQDRDAQGVAFSEAQERERLKADEQFRAAEEQRLRQSLQSSEMNATFDPNQGSLGRRPLPPSSGQERLQMLQSRGEASDAGQERLQMLQSRGGVAPAPSYADPPPTQPRGPLSAAQLQMHLNSLEQQSDGRPPATQQVGSPPPPNYTSLAQDSSSPPLLPRAVAAQSTLSPGSPGQPLPSANQPVAAVLPEYSQEDVERMKHQITADTDGLKVQVYNQYLQLEPKRLSLNIQLGKIGIFDVGEGGLGYPTAFFDIPDLKCITQGISQSIVEAPPPAELALGFRFSQELPDSNGKDRSQDKFLCFVFDSADMCILAGEAFSQLCGVPVAPAI